MKYRVTVNTNLILSLSFLSRIRDLKMTSEPIDEPIDAHSKFLGGKFKSNGVNFDLNVPLKQYDSIGGNFDSIGFKFDSIGVESEAI